MVWRVGELAGADLGLHGLGVGEHFWSAGLHCWHSIHFPSHVKKLCTLSQLEALVEVVELNFCPCLLTVHC